MARQARTKLISVIAASLCLTACAAEGAVQEIVKDEINESAGSEALAPEVQNLTVDQLKAKIADGNIRLIDVRRDDEVAQGMIPGAEHIALDDFDPAALDLSDGREVVLYCRSGRRSGIAGEKLAAHIREPVQHLAGGITAWREANSTE